MPHPAARFTQSHDIMPADLRRPVHFDHTRAYGDGQLYPAERERSLVVCFRICGRGLYGRHCVGNIGGSDYKRFAGLPARTATDMDDHEPRWVALEAVRNGPSQI